MNMPFTVDQFLGVFRDYNLSIWPTQVIAYILAISAFVFTLSKSRNKDRFISVILSVFWFWNGAAYHLMNFTRINKAAYIFGTLFLVQGILFFIYGTIKNKITFCPKNFPRIVLGSMMIIYAAVIYPLIGYLLGHGYPYSPLLGVTPCPTTIFTFGLLVLAKEDIPLKLVWIPFLWTLIGTNASWAFGIWEDMGMLTAGVTSLILIIYSKYKYKPEGSKAVSGTCNQAII